MGVFEFRERMRRILSSIIRPQSEAAHEFPSYERVETDLLDWEPPVMWPYAGEYSRNIGEGHQKPPPAFGCPTLVMHVGVWQKRQSDEVHHFDERTAIERKFGSFDEHNERFVEEVNKFVVSIQKLGRVLREGEPEDSNIDSFLFKGVEGAYQGKRRRRQSGKVAHRFKSYEPQSVAFTLWWRDCGPDFKPLPNRRAVHPEFGSLRVRVQVHASTDHVTISFFIDVGKPYGHKQIYSPHEAGDRDIGVRRRQISNYLRTIREVSAQQIREGHVERDRVPELGVTPETAGELLEAADYLYDGVWRDFMESFDIHDGALGGGSGKGVSEGERFADYRGMVMSVPGLDTPPNRERASAAASLRRELDVRPPENLRERNANVGVGALNNFDFDNNEPNTILKSLWPFLRRMTPWADYKDFVGCGMIGRRLIYVSPMGAAGKFYADEEGPDRSWEVPARSLPKEEKWDRRTPRPIRYLALTRGEPHREQTGRFIEVINNAATKRLFALKKFVTIKNAGVHVRLLGRELDGVLQLWGDERKKIEDWHNWELFKLERPSAACRIESRPEDAIVAYLMTHRPHDIRSEKTADGERRFDPADIERLRKAHQTDYYDVRMSLDEILEEHPERIWIGDVTIYHVFREVARSLDAEVCKRKNNNHGGAGRNGGAQATLKLAEKLPDMQKFLSAVAELQAREQQDVPSARKQQLGDARAEKTSILVKEVEQGLVEIGAALDNIGNGGAGRILYAINRAKYTITDFEKIVSTMGVTNIDGWINYSQFIERGVSPSFDLIRSTGERLVSLRARLQSVTEMIQTSALIVEAEATRTNTATLRRIISNLYYVGAPMAVVAAGMIGEALGSILPPEYGIGSAQLKLGFMGAAACGLILYRLLRKPDQDDGSGDGDSESGR